MDATPEAPPADAAPLDYTRLGADAPWVDWRPDDNGITFIGKPDRLAKAVLVVSLLAALAVLMALACVNVIRTAESFEKCFAALPAIILIGALAGASAQVRSLSTPPRLRIDRDGALLVVPDVFSVHRQRIPRGAFRLVVKTEATLIGPPLGSLILRRHGSLFGTGRRIFTAYPRAELDRIVSAVETYCDQHPSSPQRTPPPPPSISSG